MWQKLMMGAAAVLLTGCPEFGTAERPLTTEIPETPTWSEHVKPILNVYCNECHSSPPQRLAPGNLRLDVCETVGGIPGAQSQAFRIQIRTIDQLPSAMPPLDYEAGYPSAADQEILQRWIDQGASCDGATSGVNNGGTSDMGTTTSDMGMTGTTDMNMAVDMGMDMAEDMGMDMAPDLGPPAATWAEVSAMLVMKCASCHDGGRGNLVIPNGGTPADVQANVENMTAQNGDMNAFITPNNTAMSEIYLRVTEANMAARMPPNSAAVDQALADALESWINDGAPYN